MAEQAQQPQPQPEETKVGGRGGRSQQQTQAADEPLFSFDDLMQQASTTEETNLNAVKASQQSCLMEDLPEEFQSKNAYGYQAPQVSLQAALMADIHDPILAKHKEQLLGEMGGNARASIAIAVKPVVEFEKIEIMCPDRPQGNIVLDLTRQQQEGISLSQLVQQEYTLKEGEWTRLRITFKVHNTVVLGLKICSAIDTKVKLFKDEEVLGTYAPRMESQVVETDWVQTPDGFFQRGTYKSKLFFADADNIVHLMFDSKISIKKSW